MIATLQKLTKFFHSIQNSEKFGLYSVNMTSARRERTPKKSAKFMQTVTATRKIPEVIISLKMFDFYSILSLFRQLFDK